MSMITEVGLVWKSLTKAEQRKLNSDAMNCPEVGLCMRCKIVRNLVRGEQPTKMAWILGCSRSQVYRVAERFISDGLGGLVDHREDNGLVKADETYASFILKAVSHSPREYGFERPTWTQELLVIVARNALGVQTSRTTMGRLLHRLKVRRGRPKPYVNCPWTKAAKTRRINQIRRLEQALPKRHCLFFVDEVDIHLNPKIGFDWMLTGQQKHVLTPGKNQKRYLAGALNFKTRRLTWVEGASKNSALFVKLIDELLLRYRGVTTLHIVLDNFRIHTSHAVEVAKLRWQDKVQFYFLPPYCPDENRIERFWKDLHDNVTRNHTCREMDELMACVIHYLNQRNTAGSHVYAQCG
jgi:transposase